MKREITEKDIHLAKGMAGVICKNWGGYSNEDVDSAAVLGLVIAAKTFDGRGTFRGWLAKKVEQEVVGYLRKSKRPRHAVRHNIKFEWIPFDSPVEEMADFKQWITSIGFRTRRDQLAKSNDGMENRVIAKDLLQKFSKETGIDLDPYINTTRSRGPYMTRSLQKQFREFLQKIEQ